MAKPNELILVPKPLSKLSTQERLDSSARHQTLTRYAGNGQPTGSYPIQFAIQPTPMIKDSRCFFSLPREIRDRIYFETLRPDCSLNCRKHHTHIKNARRCTKLLQLSRRIYCEAIEMIHSGEVNFSINELQQFRFRHPKDFGLPSLFIADKASTAASIPPRFSELEFVRMRRICLTVEFGRMDREGSPQYSQFDNSITKAITRVLDRLVKVIPKMANLEHIRLRMRLQGEFNQDGNTTDTTSKKNSLKRLLDVIAINNIKLILGPHQVWFDDDHLVESEDSLMNWLNTKMKNLQMNVSYTESRGLPTGYLLKKRLEAKGGPEWINRPIVSNYISPIHWTRDFDKDEVGTYQDCMQPYQLIPECRTCLTIFKS